MLYIIIFGYVRLNKMYYYANFTYFYLFNMITRKF